MDKRWTLAIDFGTTFTSAAVGADGRIDLIEVDGVGGCPPPFSGATDRSSSGSRPRRNVRPTPTGWNALPSATSAFAST